MQTNERDYTGYTIRYGFLSGNFGSPIDAKDAEEALDAAWAEWNEDETSIDAEPTIKSILANYYIVGDQGFDSRLAW